MKKYSIVLLFLLILSSCTGNKNYNKVTIIPQDSTKVVSVEIHYVDTVHFIVPSNVSDSIIMGYSKQFSDSIRKDSIRKDNLQRENFRKITKKINGGYNGQSDRERIWERAKDVLKNK